jgi:hypothetical protein
VGFDTSFHPVDVKLIHERLVPFIRGEGSIDDLVARAVATAKVRFRANAWGNGLLQHKLAASLPPGVELPAGMGPPPLPEAVRPALDAFESDLHVWGRPFFVVADTPAEVSKGIDRYLAATADDVDGVARDMLGRLHPELASHVVPDMEGGLPPDDQIARSVRWKMDLFRQAHEAHLAGKKEVELPDGEMAEVANLFARDLAHALLELQSHLRPGWMARGHCWPTLFARPLVPFFEKADSWVAPLRKTVPGAGSRLESTITENYMVGGFVPAERMADFARELERNRPDLEKALEEEGWEGADRDVALRKLEESIADAASRGLGFCEATEIYSAPMGIMN